MEIPASSIEKLAEELFEKIRLYSNSDLKVLTKAYNFARLAHQGQLRKSGEPYLMHPLRAAEILARLRVDEDTLCATLLHDVPEDTSMTLSEIEKKFGPKIAYLVDGITKLEKIHYREQMEQRHIESLKKLFIHSAEDLRVILIKLADRLDNMRTLQFIADEKKRNRIARETLEIYVPIANLLGIGEIRAELEDLCFEHLHPVDYSNLKREVEENTEERNFILDEMMRITEKELRKNNIEAELIGRPKTLYSIYKKLQIKQTLYNIDDLIAIRVIVPNRKECYEVLGMIHRIFKPKRGRVKDYIAIPKPNGYQSLHTTVFGLSGSVVEFQVRTHYMHLEAEYGIAAHYFYKHSDERELASIMQQRSSWVKRILEMQKDQSDSSGFLENLKLDVFQDRIFIFSPKGDVIDLPRGACAIDFAYAIHTDVGRHASKAEINGILLPATSTLATGDTVNIITNRDAKPELEWLSHVKTSHASNKIKEILEQEPLEKKIIAGQKALQKEFDHLGKNFLDELTPKKLKTISKKIKFADLNEILVAVGSGSLTSHQIISALDVNDESSIKKKNITKIGILSRIGLKIIGDNSKNQFREILRTLNSIQIPIVKFIIDKPWYLNNHRCILSIMIKNHDELTKVFENLEHLECVKKISRRFISRKIWFTICALATISLWLLHPLALQFVIARQPYSQTVSDIIIYGGIVMLFWLVFYLKNTAQRSFPELEETKYYWHFLYIINTFALIVIINEIFIFKIHTNWIFMLGLIISIYALLTVNYTNYKKNLFI
ncbi:MAG: RelA/SpoT family protein [Patescibacteria group bacterium]